MNAEVMQVIGFLLDQHVAKDNLINSISAELEKMKKEKQDTTTAKKSPTPTYDEVARF